MQFLASESKHNKKNVVLSKEEHLQMRHIWVYSLTVYRSWCPILVTNVENILKNQTSNIQMDK